MAYMISTNAIGAGLRVDFDGEDFRRRAYIMADQISRLGLKFRTWREPLQRSLVEVIVPATEANFQAEGRPSWPPLKAYTVKRRIKEGFAPGPILQRTGRLKAAAVSKKNWKITTVSGGRGAANALVFEAEAFGEFCPYGQFHQTGTRKMPARPFIGLQNEEIDMIEGIFATYLDKKMDEAWGSLPAL